MADNDDNNNQVELQDGFKEFAKNLEKLAIDNLKLKNEKKSFHEQYSFLEKKEQELQKKEQELQKKEQELEKQQKEIVPKEESLDAQDKEIQHQAQKLKEEGEKLKDIKNKLKEEGEKLKDSQKQVDVIKILTADNNKLIQENQALQAQIQGEKQQIQEQQKQLQLKIQGLEQQNQEQNKQNKQNEQIQQLQEQNNELTVQNLEQGRLLAQQQKEINDFKNGDNINNSFLLGGNSEYENLEKQLLDQGYNPHQEEINKSNEQLKEQNKQQNQQLDNQKQQLENQNQQNNQLHDKNNQLEQKIQQQNKELDNQKQQLENQNKQNNQLHDKNNQLEQKIQEFDKLKQEFNNQKEQNQQLQQEFNQQISDLEKQNQQQQQGLVQLQGQNQEFNQQISDLEQKNQNQNNQQQEQNKQLQQEFNQQISDLEKQNQQQKQGLEEQNNQLQDQNQGLENQIQQLQDQIKQQKQELNNQKEQEQQQIKQVLFIGKENNLVQNQSKESDLYSAIMDVNSGRAAIMDPELLGNGKNFDGTKKYNDLSVEEKKILANKLINIAYNSSAGACGSNAMSESKEGSEKLLNLKEFDTNKDSAFNKLSESIPFKSVKYEEKKDGVKTSDIISPDGVVIGFLEKTKRTETIDGKEVDFWETKLNLNENAAGRDVVAKLFFCDSNGNESDISMIIGQDKDGVPIISAPLDLEPCTGNKNDMIKLKRDGKTYVGTTSYDHYEKQHEGMLNKTQFSEIKLSQDMSENNILADAKKCFDKNSKGAPSNLGTSGYVPRGEANVKGVKRM